MNTASIVTGAALYVLFWFTMVAACLSAAIVDGSAYRFGWMAADILVSPFGVVRGVLMWIGVAG